MNLWYDAFLHSFSLDQSIQALRADGFSLFQRSFQEDALIRDYYPQITGLAPWGGEQWNSSHHRDSAGRMFQYYTREIAETVFDIQRADFLNFGYPAWNGDPNTFRLVR